MPGKQLFEKNRQLYACSASGGTALRLPILPAISMSTTMFPQCGMSRLNSALALSPRGRSLEPVILSLKAWGDANLLRKLDAA
jgi:hypothetical protein